MIVDPLAFLSNSDSSEDEGMASAINGKRCSAPNESPTVVPDEEPLPTLEPPRTNVPSALGQETDIRRRMNLKGQVAIGTPLAGWPEYFTKWPPNPGALRIDHRFPFRLSVSVSRKW